jgi:hypothetical protein
LAKKKEREEMERRERTELEKYKIPKVALDKSEGNIGGKERSIAAHAMRSAASDISQASSANGSVSPLLEPLETYSASNIDDALSLLESLTMETATGALERHPERRMKAAFAAYEERETPILRAENPGLRHSQLRERLFKTWQRAPENPFNQAHITHTATREEEVSAIKEHAERGLERFRATPPPQ